MSSPKDSVSVSKLIKIYDIPLDFPNSVSVIYEEDTELISSTLERGLISIKEAFVKSVSIYDFVFLENPYTNDIKDVVIFVNDENKARLVLDNTWVLENEGTLITCNDKIKSKGKIKVFAYNDELCEVNLSLSILKKIASIGNNYRANEILKEIENIASLDSWLSSKLKEIDFSQDIFLSPVLYPALTHIMKLLGRNIHKIHEYPSNSKVTFITTGVDLTIVRKKEFELRRSKFDVKEVILDVDPLFAPIYLILITYLFKQQMGGK